MKKVWISWEQHRRSKSLSSALDAKYFEFDFHTRSFCRYVKCMAFTIQAIVAERPEILFVQNPSIVLATLAIFIGKLTALRVVVDSHNAGLKPKEGGNPSLDRWANWVIRNADLTLVTNQILYEFVAAKRGRPFVIPDPLPQLVVPENHIQLKGKHNVLFICSWSDDEPYLEVLKAAKLIRSDITIYVTGSWQNKFKTAKLNTNLIPNNVVLTGFIHNADFDQLLYGCDIVVDLTTRNDCMVCGAYEGAEACKPLILSQSIVLESYFSKSSLFTNNSAADIAAKIDEAMRTLPQLRLQAASFRAELNRIWPKYMAKLENEIAALPTTDCKIKKL